MRVQAPKKRGIWCGWVEGLRRTTVKRKFVVIMGFWALFGIAQQSAAQADYALLGARIQQFAEQKQLPALSLQIVDENGPVWSAGFDNRPDTAEVTVDANTVYRVGSISKLFTDIALMQLVEEGIVELSAPVSRYLPSFAPQNPFESEVTVEALMSHRSGLVREPPLGNYFDDSEPSIKAVVDSSAWRAVLSSPAP